MIDLCAFHLYLDHNPLTCSATPSKVFWDRAQVLEEFLQPEEVASLALKWAHSQAPSQDLEGYRALYRFVRQYQRTRALTERAGDLRRTRERNRRARECSYVHLGDQLKKALRK